MEYLSSAQVPVLTDITNYVNTLDEFNLQDNGVISTAKLTLKATNGDFITNTNNGSTPLVSQFDRIKITIIDDTQTIKHTKIFEVTTDLAQLNMNTQYYLPLELEGRERNLKGIPFSGFYRDPPLNFHQMIQEIVVGYGAGIGTAVQPRLTTFLGLVDQNDAPKWNPNIWDFTNITNTYDALQFVLEQMNQPVSAGGAGNRFGMKFVDDPNAPNSMILRVLVQGENNFDPQSTPLDVIPTIKQNSRNPIIKIDKIKQTSTGTQIIARGRAKSGHLFSEYDKFISRLEFYRNIPEFDNTVIYPLNAVFKYQKQRFRVTSVHNPGDPPSSMSVPIDVGEYIGRINYSPLTKNMRNEHLNSWGNPEGSFGDNSFSTVGIPDSNLTIRDKNPTDATSGTNREEVLFRSNTDQITNVTGINNYVRTVGNNLIFPEGTQVLVDTSIGAVAGAFVGNDLNTRPYANSVVRFQQGKWYVIREASNYDQVAVRYERKIYEYNKNFTSTNRIYPGSDRGRGATGDTFAWRDLSTQFMGNECFHSPSSVTQVDGLLADEIQNDEPLNDPDGTPYIQNSGLKIDYTVGSTTEKSSEQNVWKNIARTVLIGANIGNFISALTTAVFNRFVTPEYTTFGWWWSIAFPFPRSTHNSVSEIGSVYGGPLNDVNRSPFFDVFNTTRTRDGKRGYNQTNSDSHGEIVGFTTLLNFDIRIGTDRIPFTGNVPFTCWARDKDGTKWKSGKLFIRHLGETGRLTFFFGDMSPVYYSRTPIGIFNILTNLLVPEIEKNKVLLKENIVEMGVQCELPYDDNGRYNVDIWESIIKPTVFNLFTSGTSITLTGTLDATNWIKTPIAISNSVTSTPSKRIITPQVRDFPNIVNIEQLQRYADAQEQVDTFQYEQYTVVQGGIADLELEDSVYLEDGKLINEDDNSSQDNTRLLIVRGIKYSVPKDKGLLRTLTLVRKVQ